MVEPENQKIRRTQAEIIELIYKALPAQKFETVHNIADKAGVDRETTVRNLEIISLVLNLQSGNWLEKIQVGDSFITAFRRKRKRGEKK